MILNIEQKHIFFLSQYLIELKIAFHTLNFQFIFTFFTIIFYFFKTSQSLSLIKLFFFDLCFILIYTQMNGHNANDFLQTQWKNSQSQQLFPSFQNLSLNRVEYSYKILKKQIILRSSQFTLYRGLQKTRQFQRKGSQSDNFKISFKDVAIKKYEIIQRNVKSQQKIKQPIQYAFLKSKEISWLQHYSINFFEYKNEYYHVMKSMEQLLYDKIKFGVREFRQLKELGNAKFIKSQFITDFFKQIIDILLRCHQLRSPFFLGGLRPIYIGVSDKFESEYKKSYTYYIIDYSLANTQPRQCPDKYDSAYLAPQHKTSDLDAKSDVWSLGCILFELLSYGDKLIDDSAFHDFSFQAKQAFIQDKLNQLTYRLEYQKSSKYKPSFGSINVLKECLKIDPKARKSTSELAQMMQHEKPFFDAPLNEVKLSSELLNFYESKIIYDISMEIFRLNQIQDNIMSVFQELFFNKSKNISKFHLYPLLKFASCYYLEAFNKLKDKSRIYAKNQKWDKYSQVKRIQQEKNLTDIRDKAGSKMIKELDQQKKIELKKEVLKRFPQIKDDKGLVNPRQLFEEYFRYVKKDFCFLKNSNFYKYMVYIHFYIKQLAEMERYLSIHTKESQISLKLSPKNLEQHKDPEIVYFYRVSAVTAAIQKRIQLILPPNSQNYQQQDKKLEEEIESNMAKYLDEILAERQ